MEIIYLLAPLALILATIAISAFIWAVQKGQYDDLDTPSMRLLLEDVESQTNKKQNKFKTQLDKKDKKNV